MVWAVSPRKATTASSTTTITITMEASGKSRRAKTTITVTRRLARTQKEMAVVAPAVVVVVAEAEEATEVGAEAEAEARAEGAAGVASEVKALARVEKAPRFQSTWIRKLRDVHDMDLNNAGRRPTFEHACTGQESARRLAGWLSGSESRTV